MSLFDNLVKAPPILYLCIIFLNFPNNKFMKDTKIILMVVLL